MSAWDGEVLEEEGRVSAEDAEIKVRSSYALGRGVVKK